MLDLPFPYAIARSLANDRRSDRARATSPAPFASPTRDRRDRPIADVAAIDRASRDGKASDGAGSRARANARANAGSSDAARDVDTPVALDENSDKALLICAFDVAGASAEQERAIRDVMALKPNYSYKVTDVKAEMGRIKSLGIFKVVRAFAKDTRDGIRVTFEVSPFERMRGVELYGLESVPVKAIEESFKPQMGKVINHAHVIETLGRFKDYTRVAKNVDSIENILLVEDASDGIVRLEFTDLVLDEVKVEIEPSINQKTGKENKVLSKPSSVLAYFSNIQRGKPVNGWRVMDTLQSFSTENPRFGEPQVNLISKPGKQAGKRDILLTLKEKACKGITGGGGMTAKGFTEGIFSGFAGYLQLYHNNLFGQGQTLNVGVEATPKKGGRGITVVRPQLKMNYRDPWVGFGPTRTSRTMSIESQNSNLKSTHGVPSNQATDGDTPDITAPGLSEITVQRFSHSIEHTRPLLNGWNGLFSMGFNRNAVLDNDGNHTLFDAYGAPVTFSGTKHDTSLTSQLRFAYSGPNDAVLVLSAEQAFPLQPQWLNYTRMFARAKRSFPLFSSPVQLLLSSKGGNVIGDLPPYEAFAIGGTTSVRGYNDGGIGTGRKFVVGSAELRAPVTSGLTGAIFFDYGSDLHSGAAVLGDPAGTRGKPGVGYGYGVAGIFTQSGIPFRFDYARNDRGSGRFHFSLSRDFN